MGLPINSPADDAHFQLARDGFTGFLSSSRKDGIGQRDLYVAYFTKYRQEMEPPVVANFQPALPVTSTPDTPVLSNPSTTTAPPPEINAPVVNHPPFPTKWKIAANSLSQLSVSTWTNEVLEATQTYPGDQLLISCYIPQQADATLTARLFDAISQLRHYSQSLIQQGLAAHRIFLRAQPYAGPTFQLVLSLAPPAGETARQNLPVLGTAAYPGPGLASDQVLCYKVQVVSVQKSYVNNDLSQRSDLMLENATHLPYLRYTAGAATTYAAADRIRRQLVAEGYSGAYVVPYVYGIRLERDQIAAYSTQFRDLQDYLKR
jgi:hypothetical protein